MGDLSDENKNSLNWDNNCKSTKIVFDEKEVGAMFRTWLNRAARRKPFPTAAMMPVGPLMLSTHPGIGSRHAAVTIDGRTMATGTSRPSACSNDSATAFVRPYVLVGRVNSAILQRAPFH